MLRRKTLLIISATLVGLLACVYTFSRIVLLRSFARLEEEDARQNLERGMRALSNDLSNLDRISSDYGNWDQTYAFAAGLNRGYANSELPTQAFLSRNLRVNLVVILDTSNRVLVSKAVDLAKGKECSVPPSLYEALQYGSRLLNKTEAESKTVGIMLLPEGPVLIVARPILTSAEKGPSRGTFIMGRWLDGAEVRHLAETSQLSLSVGLLNHDGVPGDSRFAFDRLSDGNPSLVRPLNSATVAAFRRVDDISGNPALILRVELPRRIYQQGQNSLLHFMQLFLASGFLFGAVILVLLEGFVLSRVFDLSRNVAKVGAAGDLSARLPISGNDELSVLGASINHTLDALEKSQEERHEREARLHMLIGQVPAVLWTTDAALRFTSLLGAGLESLRLKTNELVGVSLSDYFSANQSKFESIAAHQRALLGETVTYEQAWSGRAFHSHVEPLRNADGMLTGTIGMALDITDRKRSEALLVAEKRLLETIAKGDPLPVILDNLARAIEQLAAGMICSILLLDSDENILRHGAAPSLPQEYIHAIDGIAIGPKAGSCGTAAYNKETVIVADIATDPLWKDCRHFALSYELRSCWSVPILATSGKVLGTFAIYYREARGPSDLEVDLIERGAHLAGIAMERRRAEQKLIHNALHDTLTTLPNRALFLDRLQREYSRSKKHPEYKFAVLFIDIDGFKMVNDSLGHSAGDRLIVEIADRLRAVLRGNDTVSRLGQPDKAESSVGSLARLGGDEFTVLLEDIKDPSDAIRAAERIQKALAMPYFLGGQEVFTSASIGIALSTTPHNSAEDLLRDADIAMYRAKAMGKGRCEVFDTAMHARAVERLKLETDLRKGVERQEFCVHYQPIVSLDAGRAIGFEALVRWQHPELGLLAPGEFIQVAEETSLILPIGKWVLHEACRQIVVWQSQFPSNPALTISVNISPKQFAQPDLVNEIRLVLQQSGLDPSSLRLEITETMAMGDAERARGILSQLKALGVRLSIDDFGTGYSSLNYLRRFPVDTVKIDRSFVSKMDSSDSREIVRIIIMLARNLGLDVVAEGTETAAQVNLLKELNCEFGQGYFFSRPVDSDAITKLLTRAFEVSGLKAQRTTGANAN